MFCLLYKFEFKSQCHDYTAQFSVGQGVQACDLWIMWPIQKHAVTHLIHNPLFHYQLCYTWSWPSTWTTRRHAQANVIIRLEILRWTLLCYQTWNGSKQEVVMRSNACVTWRWRLHFWIKFVHRLTMRSTSRSCIFIGNSLRAFIRGSRPALWLSVHLHCSAERARTRTRTVY